MSTEPNRFAYWKAHRPKETVRLLTLSEAAELFGVPYLVIYRLAELELIDPLQRDGKGRVYYSERQIRRSLTKCYPALEAA